MTQKILLLTQDAKFADEMVAAAVQKSLELTWASSVFQLGRIGALSEFSLIITDEKLQNLTGREVADYVRAFLKEMPVVVLSDGAPAASPRRVKEAAKGYLDSYAKKLPHGKDTLGQILKSEAMQAAEIYSEAFLK